MNWTDFHSHCRLLAVDHPSKAETHSAAVTLASQLHTQLLSLPAAQRQHSARLYGQLNFQHTAIVQHSKTALFYLSLLFVMFVFISILHLEFIWPSFDAFYQQIEPKAVSSSAKLRQLWPFVILGCAAILLLCWLYCAATNQLLNRGSTALHWLLSKRAKQLHLQLTELSAFPLHIHGDTTSALQQRLQPLLAEPALLLCELQQQWQLQQHLLAQALRSRLHKLQLCSAVVIVLALGQLIFINYRHLFDMGTVI